MLSPNPIEHLRAACKVLAGHVHNSRRFDDAQRLGVRMFTAAATRVSKLSDISVEWQLLRSALNGDALLNDDEAAAVKQLKTAWRESWERELLQPQIAA